ncbi:uncharacterized protein LAESUDRAFT_715695 [Laetiporus sulphureus 93-53]|uniref:Uncharacterized protein n=1 Tax=Laetiporus sulphureus 93-53 TaxID=1314785 RepID=A0A165D4G3_9APHY|nr:uncharacterized protein LAESUDRAFT_715695 [Laetiporus sulphureus 93-53]KZT04138.1 hypothetical protein LAESUDRAFT_715695 [Laetiporus sulphureus 93-53]
MVSSVARFLLHTVAGHFRSSYVNRVTNLGCLLSQLSAARSSHRSGFLQKYRSVRLIVAFLASAAPHSKQREAVEPKSGTNKVRGAVGDASTDEFEGAACRTRRTANLRTAIATRAAQLPKAFAPLHGIIGRAVSATKPLQESALPCYLSVAHVMGPSTFQKQDGIVIRNGQRQQRTIRLSKATVVPTIIRFAIGARSEGVAASRRSKIVLVSLSMVSYAPFTPSDGNCLSDCRIGRGGSVTCGSDAVRRHSSILAASLPVVFRSSPTTRTSTLSEDHPILDEYTLPAIARCYYNTSGRKDTVTSVPWFSSRLSWKAHLSGARGRLLPRARTSGRDPKSSDVDRPHFYGGSRARCSLLMLAHMPFAGRAALTSQLVTHPIEKFGPLRSSSDR